MYAENVLRRDRIPRWKATTIPAEYWVASLILVVTVVLRFAWLGTHPGYEWDEPVYTYIAGNLADNGLLEAKREYYRSVSEAYLYHPPFYFGLLAAWFKVFGVGIFQARILASIGSVVTTLILYFFLRRIAGWKWAAVATGLLSIDAWLVFTSRVSWIENTMMPIGAVAHLLYGKFVLEAPVPSNRRESFRFWAGVVVTGSLLGATAAYKHVGAYLVLAVFIGWFTSRLQHKRHAVVVVTFAVTALAYISAMTVYFNNNFLDQAATQLRRSLGRQESRGALTSIEDVLEPLTSQYAIYWVSILLTVFAVTLLIIRTVLVALRRCQMTAGETVFYSWALGAVIFFIVLQLKIPHYFLMLQIPLLCYLVLEVRRFMAARSFSLRAKFVAGVAIALIVIANAFALTMRLGVLDGNPLQQTANWTAANIPATATVVTEESVGHLISQPYCKMAFARNCPDAEYIITYTSITQEVPDSRSVEVMLERGVLLERFNGFKEEISIYQIQR